MKKRFLVRVKSHRDRNGNTYHNVKIYDNNNGRVYTSGKTYGYGSQWKQTANELLKKNRLRTQITYSNSVIDEQQVRTSKALNFNS